jgi:hypothetical protein
MNGGNGSGGIVIIKTVQVIGGNTEGGRGGYFIN